MARYLDTTGLSALWAKLKGTFAQLSASNTFSGAVNTFKKITLDAQGTNVLSETLTLSYNGITLKKAMLSLDEPATSVFTIDGGNTKLGKLGGKDSLAFAELTGKPTTLGGYGIADGVNAVTTSGSGEVVTAASVSGHTLTLTKGLSYAKDGDTAPWGKLAYIATSGVQETGQYLDFHNKSATARDYSVRLIANSSTSSAQVNLPTSNGTLALTSQIPTNYATTDTAQTISGAKTFSAAATFSLSVKANSLTVTNGITAKNINTDESISVGEELTVEGFAYFESETNFDYDVWFYGDVYMEDGSRANDANAEGWFEEAFTKYNTASQYLTINFLAAHILDIDRTNRIATVRFTVQAANEAAARISIMAGAKNSFFSCAGCVTNAKGIGSFIVTIPYDTGGGCAIGEKYVYWAAAI